MGERQPGDDYMWHEPDSPQKSSADYRHQQEARQANVDLEVLDDAANALLPLNDID